MHQNKEKKKVKRRGFEGSKFNKKYKRVKLIVHLNFLRFINILFLTLNIFYYYLFLNY